MAQNLIFYQGGCYGTFVEWLCNFLEDDSIKLPFKDTGSSHKFAGHLFFPKEKLFNHIASGNKYRFSRCHPGLFEKINEHENSYKDSYDNVLQEDLTFLKEHFDKILVINYDYESILWAEHNIFTKGLETEETYNAKYREFGYNKEYFNMFLTPDYILRIKHTINREINSKSSPIKKENLLGWGHDTVYDFELWELRELLSLYWFERNYGQINAYNLLIDKNKDILFLSISDLIDNFTVAVEKISNFFNINTNQSSIEKLDDVYNEWVKLQYNRNKDAVCNKIVDTIIKNKDFEWQSENLSIIDEAFIQKKLSDNGIQIKCYKLDVFPTNSRDFQLLLEREN